ncbi:hypothetical protein P154DRAFT_108980 [Amniculicola lignicola CBS 123094]|uniref:Uncharacterized protein n=1 Tax=Amniculicola lignicola CBS 123094 TaxID=1392246 RepID=A0A6A5WM08_9PLEO|nr:hypothetical protein P154DRAFT_108980 [Amniculicola lignicola CBS 123094]
MIPLRFRMKSQREREDAQVWRDRLIGKRLVTSDPDVLESLATQRAKHPKRYPKVYSYELPGEGFDKHLEFNVQLGSRLLQLPAEIKNRILEFALSPPPQLHDTYSSIIEWGQRGAVILACKQLYAEGRTMALELNTFPYESLQAKTNLTTNNPSLLINNMYIYNR